MSSVLNSIVKNLESLPSSLLKDLAEALGQSKTGNKEILAHRIAYALTQKKEMESPSKRRGYEDREFYSKPKIISGFPGKPKTYPLPGDFVSASSIDNAITPLFISLSSQGRTYLSQLIYNALAEAIKNLAVDISYQGDVHYTMNSSLSTTVNLYKVDTQEIRNNLLYIENPFAYGRDGNVIVNLDVMITAQQNTSFEAYLYSYSVSNNRGFNING